MKTKTCVLFAFISLIIFSCNDDTYDDILVEETKVFEIDLNSIILTDDILEIENKETLNSILTQSSDENFDKTISDLNSKGFNSLLPVFKDHDGPEMDQFLIDKKERLEKNGRLYSSKTSEEGFDIEDEIIADNKFAGLLNSNRAIIIEGIYYVYTTNGLYFAEKKNKSILKKYLKDLEKDKSFKISSKEECNMQKSNGNRKEMSISPVGGEVTLVTNEISLFTIKCDGGGGTGGGGTTPTPTPTTTKLPLLKAQNLGVCVYDEDSIWQQVFGDTEKCNDYHDSTHRVQTKFWNQNYYIFASIGASVKYQKKRWIGWSRSDTAEFVELGVNRLAYTYNDPIKSFNPWDDRRAVVTYKGISYDLSGKRIYKYPENSGQWPLEDQKATVAEIDVYIFGEDIYLPLTGKDANKTINTVLNKISGWAVKELKDQFGTDKVRVNILKFGQSAIDVVVVDRIKKAKSLASHPVDLNFLASYNSSNDTTWKQLTDQLRSKKYTKVSIDMYGIAKRNGVLKGKRIVGSGKDL